MNKVLVSDLFEYPRSIPDTFELEIIPELGKDKKRLLDLIPNYDGLIVRNVTTVDSELLAAAERLKIIGRLGVGLDNIDLKAAKKAGIKVVYTPDANSLAVAEYCLGQLLNLFRRLPPANADTKGGGWNRLDFLGREVAGSTVGVIGFGNSGRRFAELASKLGAKVLVCTRRPNQVPTGYETVSFDSLMKNSDAVSLHVPFTSETRKMINSDSISLMKKDAVLINASRGEVVDEDAVLNALVKGRLSGAAIDVRAVEPPVCGPLEECETLIMSPHIAAFTTEAQERVSKTVINDFHAFFSGCSPKCLAE